MDSTFRKQTLEISWGDKENWYYEGNSEKCKGMIYKKSGNYGYYVVETVKSTKEWRYEARV